MDPQCHTSLATLCHTTDVNVYGIPMAWVPVCACECVCTCAGVCVCVCVCVCVFSCVCVFCVCVCVRTLVSVSVCTRACACVCARTSLFQVVPAIHSGTYMCVNVWSCMCLFLLGSPSICLCIYAVSLWLPSEPTFREQRKHRRTETSTKGRAGLLCTK